MVHWIGDLTYTQEGPGETHHGGQQVASWQWQQSSLPEEEGIVMGELISGWLISYQGNQQRSTTLTAPLINHLCGAVLI